MALKLLGIRREVFYASEIDEISMAISRKNHGDEVIQVGDIRLITEENIKECCPLNVLIGGFPCNDLSAVNRNRKGLQGILSTSRSQLSLINSNFFNKGLFGFHMLLHVDPLITNFSVSKVVRSRDMYSLW